MRVIQTLRTKCSTAIFCTKSGPTTRTRNSIRINVSSTILLGPVASPQLLNDSSFMNYPAMVLSSPVPTVICSSQSSSSKPQFKTMDLICVCSFCIGLIFLLSYLFLLVVKSATSSSIIFRSYHLDSLFSRLLHHW